MYHEYYHNLNDNPLTAIDDMTAEQCSAGLEADHAELGKNPPQSRDGGHKTSMNE